MIELKDFTEFRKKWNLESLAGHIFLEALSSIDDTKKIYDDVLKNGLTIELIINGYKVKCPEDVLNNINISYDQFAEYFNNIKETEIENRIKEKMTDKLYSIINKIDDIENLLK